MLKRIAYALTGLVASALVAMGASLPLIPSTSQYSEPSQIVGTINALIQQLNGQAGYAAANSTVSIGSFCTNAAAGATPQVCNGQRGAVSFTGLTGIAATSTNVTLVITNSNVSANSICSAVWTTAFTAGSAVTVATVVPTAGSLSIVAPNAGTTTNAVTTGTLGFNCYN